MFKVKSDFENLALSHYGYDGGNLNSSFWVSGIEWGGGITPSQLKIDIENGPILNPKSVEKHSDREVYLKYKFDTIWLKILSRTLGFEVADYKKMISDDINALSSSGPMMKFNLYPISFKDTSPEYWNSDFYELTGFPTKELYVGWIQENRFQMFNKLVIENKPKVILCSGITFKKDFLLAFGGVKSIFSIPIETISMQENKTIFVYDSQLSKNTKIIITPFFGSVYGIKSNEQCEAVGNLIRKFCLGNS